MKQIRLNLIGEKLATTIQTAVQNASLTAFRAF